MPERTDEPQEQDDGALLYGSSETLDDIGQRLATPAPTDFTKITLDGDEIPENLRGKSVTELLSQVSRLGDALRISEESRIALKNSQEALDAARSKPTSAPPPAPAPEPELNDEQLQALFDESPRKYHDYIQQQSEKRIMNQLKGQLAPVVGNSADMTVRDAKNRYVDEFAAFGKEIQDFISQMPDRSALAQPGAMDELMDWMRGKHWKKFQEHLASKGGNGLEDARHEMGSQTPQGFERSPAPRKNGGRSAVQLDDTMKEIARALGVSEADYAASLTPRDLRMIKSYGDR